MLPVPAQSPQHSVAPCGTAPLKRSMWYQTERFRNDTNDFAAAFAQSPTIRRSCAKHSHHWPVDGDVAHSNSTPIIAVGVRRTPVQFDVRREPTAATTGDHGSPPELVSGVAVVHHALAARYIHEKLTSLSENALHVEPIQNRRTEWPLVADSAQKRPCRGLALEAQAFLRNSWVQFGDRPQRCSSNDRCRLHGRRVGSDAALGDTASATSCCMLSLSAAHWRMTAEASKLERKWRRKREKRFHKYLKARSSGHTRTLIRNSAPFQAWFRLAVVCTLTLRIIWPAAITHLSGVTAASGRASSPSCERIFDSARKASSVSFLSSSNSEA